MCCTVRAHTFSHTYLLVLRCLVACTNEKKRMSRLRDGKLKSVRDRGLAIDKRKRGRENCFVSVYLCRLPVRAKNYILCVRNRIILENSLHIFELRIPWFVYLVRYQILYSTKCKITVKNQRKFRNNFAYTFSSSNCCIGCTQQRRLGNIYCAGQCCCNH